MNSWSWESVEEFREKVYPIEHAPEAIVRAQNRAVTSRNIHSLFEYLWEYDSAYAKLRRLLAGPVEQPISKEEQDEVCLAASQLVYSAECIFAHCRPLANTKAGQELISRKETAEHLPSYQKRSLGRKLKSGAQELLKSAEWFADEIRDLFECEDVFLESVVDLPDELKADFMSARNLMSLGFDEAGLIFSGRGLEGVIRRVAKDHRIMNQPAERARFFDILAALEKKRFVHNGALVIDEATKHLLQYSRAIRNNSAHPDSARTGKGHSQQAVLMAQRANEIWKRCSAAGVQLV